MRPSRGRLLNLPPGHLVVDGDQSRCSVALMRRQVACMELDLEQQLLLPYWTRSMRSFTPLGGVRGAGAGRLLLPLPYWKRSMRRQVACAELYCLLLLRCSTRSMSSFTPPGGMRGAVAVAAAAATVLDEAYAFLRAAASWWPGQLLALAGNPTPAPFLHAAASPSKLFSVIIVWSVEYHLRP